MKWNEITGQSRIDRQKIAWIFESLYCSVNQIEDILNIEVSNPSGVIYDNSGVWSKRSALVAHTSYWSARRIFAKGVVKSFVNGEKFQYDKKYQQKVIKKKSKKSEVL